MGTRASRRHLTGRSASSTRRGTEKSRGRARAHGEEQGLLGGEALHLAGVAGGGAPPGKSGPWLCSAPRSSGGGGARASSLDPIRSSFVGGGLAGSGGVPPRSPSLLGDASEGEAMEGLSESTGLRGSPLAESGGP